MNTSQRQTGWQWECRADVIKTSPSVIKAAQTPSLCNAHASLLQWPNRHFLSKTTWNITSVESFILRFLHQCSEFICPEQLLGQTWGGKTEWKECIKSIWDGWKRKRKRKEKGWLGVKKKKREEHAISTSISNLTEGCRNMRCFSIWWACCRSKPPVTQK